MAYSYRFKVRIPLPRRPDKVLTFGLVLPFKSRKFSLGRYRGPFQEYYKVHKALFEHP
jgi:hypothetical protein